jgi:hypothetical protein
MLFFTRQIGDVGPTAHVQLCAIHFRLMGVSCRNRRANATANLPRSSNGVNSETDTYMTPACIAARAKLR